jgi:hypothetical protein
MGFGTSPVTCASTNRLRHGFETPAEPICTAAAMTSGRLGCRHENELTIRGMHDETSGNGAGDRGARVGRLSRDDRTRCRERHAGQGLEHLDPGVLRGRFLRQHAPAELPWARDTGTRVRLPAQRSLCPFVVDHLAGSHLIDVTARYQKSWGIDTGYYTEYAGAVAGPSGKCIEVLPSLQIRSGGKTYLYGAPWRKYC